MDLFAGGWLLEGALRSVAVCQWRMYCRILVVGLWLLGGWGSGAVGLQVWVSLMMSGVLFREGLDMIAVGWQGWMSLRMRVVLGR